MKHEPASEYPDRGSNPDAPEGRGILSPPAPEAHPKGGQGVSPVLHCTDGPVVGCTTLPVSEGVATDSATAPAPTRPAGEGREGVTHDLKCWPEPFAALLDGRKQYEIRVNHRDYRIGDVLRLREWHPGWRDACGGRTLGPGAEPRYTGREVERVVTYMTPGGAWGLPDGLCVLSLAALRPATPAPPEGAGEVEEQDGPCASCHALPGTEHSADCFYRHVQVGSEGDIEQARALCDRLRQAVMRAAEVFDSYAAIHDAKATLVAWSKAEANRRHARELRAALSAPRAPEAEGRNDA